MYHAVVSPATVLTPSLTPLAAAPTCPFASERRPRLGRNPYVHRGLAAAGAFAVWSARFGTLDSPAHPIAPVDPWETWECTLRARPTMAPATPARSA